MSTVREHLVLVQTFTGTLKHNIGLAMPDLLVAYKAVGQVSPEKTICQSI